MSKAGPQKAKPNVTQVEVHTWATSADGGNGAAQYVADELLGGGTGHAAVELTFPADEKGKRLIEQYCIGNGGTPIPYEKVTIPGPAGTEPQEVYKVLFSWWSNSTLTPNLNDDQSNMRVAQNVGPYNPRFAAELPPQEQRNRAARLGTEHLYLAPLQITADLNGLTDEQKHVVELDGKMEHINTSLKAMDILLTRKFPENADSAVLDATAIGILDITSSKRGGSSS